MIYNLFLVTLRTKRARMIPTAATPVTIPPKTGIDVIVESMLLSTASNKIYLCNLSIIC